MRASQAADNELLRRKLPTPALEKLLSLIAREDHLVAAYGQLFDQQPQLRRRLQIAQQKLDELERLPLRSPTFAREGGGFRYEPPGEQREAALQADRDRVIGATQQERDTVRDELQRLDQRGIDLRRRLSPVPARIVGWIRSLPDHVKIKMHDGPVPKLPPGEPKAVVQKLRDQITGLQQAIEQVKSAPIPAGLAKQIAEQWVDSLARPIDVSRTVALGHPPMMPMSVIPLPTLGSSYPLSDPVSAIAWLFRDALVDRLCAEIDRRAAEPHIEPLSPEQRARREAEVRAEILAAERLEELAIMAGEKQGIEIRRRDEAHAISVLNLADDLLAVTT